MAKTQTRQEHYDECVSASNPVTHPIPEIVTPETVVGTVNGSKVLAHPDDHNHEDFREWDEEADAWGPWQRAKS